MTADVLKYNALNEINKVLSQESSTKTSRISTLSAEEDVIEAQYNTIIKSCIECSTPMNAQLWCLIPEGTGWTTGFKVCDTTTNFNCGACCAWTVPNGVTCARFQLWGAGGGAGGGLCCSFAPFGSTGAYASVIIPVTAGCTYTLCSGCAFLCNAAQAATFNVTSCPSFVTGFGLTNFCAEGGSANLCTEVQERNLLCSSQTPFYYLGGCMCASGTFVCWQYGIGSGTGFPGYCWTNLWPMASSSRTYYGSTSSGALVYGIRGSYGSIAVNCDGAICASHPPIYGFPAQSCAVACLTSNGLGGCCRNAASGCLRAPGAGGYANMHCGGCCLPFGDYGKMGMVCVSYK